MGKNTSVLRSAGSAAFKASGRTDPVAHLISYDLPGPGEYLNDSVLKSIGTKPVVKNDKVKPVG